MKHTWWTVGVAGLMMAGLTHAGTIVDEDFDDYTGTYLSTAAGSPWTIDGCNDARLDGNVFSAPNAVRDYKNGANQRIGIRDRRNLTAAEMANANVVHGGSPTCVNGTDANPLVFSFKLRLGPNNTGYYSDLNTYAELACGDDRAPTAVTQVSCPVPGWDPPRFNPRYKLNMAGDGLLHRAIAIGQIAWEDQEPCDDGTTNSSSHSFRLTLFDGQAWHNLKTPDDVHTCRLWNYVTVTIKTSTIQVDLSTMYNGTDCTGPRNVRTTTVERKYLGPFTAIKIGGLHDEVNGGCWGQDKVSADHDGTIRAYSVEQSDMEDIGLADGEAYDTPGPCDESGACCTGHSCQQLTPTACAAIEGSVFHGANTVCWVGDAKCCASPAVDFDFDTDVDMNDFANLQRCLTIGQESQATPLNECACFDVDGTPGIDTQDVEKFVLCSSGANVPASVTCLD